MMALALVGCSKGSSNPKPKETKKETNEPKKLKDIAIAVSAAKNRRSNANHEPIWEIEWESANLGIQDGKQFGSMVKVKGMAFEKGEKSASFASDSAVADKFEEKLVLEGNVRVESDKNPKATMTAKKVEWLPNLKVFKASGDVTIASASGVVGPIDSLYADSKLHKVGTSLEYFKK